jgi:hypothetical protein
MPEPNRRRRRPDRTAVPVDFLGCEWGMRTDADDDLVLILWLDHRGETQRLMLTAKDALRLAHNLADLLDELRHMTEGRR